MIRDPNEAETQVLVDIGESTGIFAPGETEVLLRDTLVAHHNRSLEHGHQVKVWADGNNIPKGWTYFGPREDAAGQWEVYWIGVTPACHGQGIGKALLQYAEAQAVELSAEVMMIETSSSGALMRARDFYKAQGYKVVEIGPNHYGPTEDKLTFAKTLSTK